MKFRAWVIESKYTGQWRLCSAYCIREKAEEKLRRLQIKALQLQCEQELVYRIREYVPKDRIP